MDAAPTPNPATSLPMYSPALMSLLADEKGLGHSGNIYMCPVAAHWMITPITVVAEATSSAGFEVNVWRECVFVSKLCSPFFQTCPRPNMQSEHQKSILLVVC